MKTKPWAILLIIFCTLLTALGQFLLKSGANRLMLDVYAIITNYYIFLGIIAYGTASILMIWALKYGELSLLYPFISLSFVWVSLVSVFFLSEIMIPVNWLGIASIVIGVSFFGYGADYE